MKLLSPSQVRSFQKIIYDHHRRHVRDLPWRKTSNPYHILVSEIMLQQTQVERVLDRRPDRARNRHGHDKGKEEPD